MRDLTSVSLEKEVTVNVMNGDSEVTIGKSIEVRGIVKDGSTLQVNGRDFNMYDSDFDLQSYEQMLEYYHGMSKKLTLAA